MKDITVIGIDLAKKSFQIHGNDKLGKQRLKKSLTPAKAYELFANLKPCLVGMEACGGAHYAARKIRSLGHQVKIIAPQFVKPFVQGNKNDVSDAEGIAEAVSRPNIRCVPIKETHHQDIQNIHRIRERLIGNRVALTNQIRGILFEYGISTRKGDEPLKKLLVELCSSSLPGATDLLQRQMAEQYNELTEIEEKLALLEKEIKILANGTDACRRLMKIPGVGPLIATAFFANLASAEEFFRGRQMSAWLGLAPGHKQTGGPNGKTVMLPITKRGDRYLRKILVQGARAAVRTCKTKDDPLSKWTAKIYEKKGYNKAAVALANKNARIIWALLISNEEFISTKAAAA